MSSSFRSAELRSNRRSESDPDDAILLRVDSHSAGPVLTLADFHPPASLALPGTRVASGIAGGLQRVGVQSASATEAARDRTPSTSNARPSPARPSSPVPPPARLAHPPSLVDREGATPSFAVRTSITYCTAITTKETK